MPRCRATSLGVGVRPVTRDSSTRAVSMATHSSFNRRGTRTAHPWSRRYRRTSPVIVGTANASYTYAGDDNHDGSNGSDTFAITKASSSTVVTCTPDSVFE